MTIARPSHHAETRLSHLSDSELVTEVGRLARNEREATVALIVHLGEFDARRLYEGPGFSSTHTYCRKVVGLSEDAAYNRVAAARAARKYPVVLEMLAAGTLSPTTARMLAPHLTDANLASRLAEAAGKGKREMEAIVARWVPQPDVPSRIRPLAASLVEPARDAAESAAAVPPTDGGTTARNGVPAPTELPAALSSAPLPVTRVDRYEIRFSASARTYEKLRLAQDLLGHANPTGDLGDVFDRALTLLVADLEKKKFAATDTPRGSRGPSDDPRHIPADVARTVYDRDGGCCAYVSPDGHRCGERRFVELHHLIPVAVGGKPAVENLQLRCRAHNRYEAAVFFGPMRDYVPLHGITRSGTGQAPLAKCARSGGIPDGERAPKEAGRSRTTH